MSAATVYEQAGEGVKRAERETVATRTARSDPIWSSNKTARSEKEFIIIWTHISHRKEALVQMNPITFLTEWIFIAKTSSEMMFLRNENICCFQVDQKEKNKLHVHATKCCYIGILVHDYRCELSDVSRWDESLVRVWSPTCERSQESATVFTPQTHTLQSTLTVLKSNVKTVGCCRDDIEALLDDIPLCRTAQPVTLLA
ncbi:hypothetical protein CBL_05864 [Carabus blaptoides fortunei]